MRKIKIFSKLIFLLIILMSTTCDNDPNYYQDIKSDNLIFIEKKDSYNVNDILYFKSKFSRYLPENGKNKNVDLYRTTGSEKFGFNFYLQKISPVNTDFIVNKSDFVIDLGEFGNEEYGIDAICNLNKNTNEYEFRGGIKLLQPGEYKLNITTEIRPKIVTKGVSFNIITTLFEVETDRYNQASYNFTVN